LFRVDIRHAPILLSAQLGRVTPAQRHGMLLSPGGSLGSARCLGPAREKALPETLNFVSRDENVSEEFAEKPSCCVADGRQGTHNRASHAKDSGKLLDQLAIAVGLRANGIDDPVRTHMPLSDGKVGEVGNVDRLQAIVASAEDSEDG